MRVPPKPHGTEAAARRHRRAGQKPREVCPPCQEAENYAAAWRKRETKARRAAAAAQLEQAAAIAKEMAGRLDRFTAALEAGGLAVNRTGPLSVSISIPATPEGSTQ